MENNKLKQRFSGLYEAESDSIFRYCFFRIGNRENAKDLSQETFLRFWSVLSEGKDIHNDKAFIFMIAKNLVIDFYRKKKSISLDAILDENEDGMFIAGKDRLKEDIEMSSEGRFILHKISELEPNDQQILYLRFVEDLRPKEIAEILNVSPNVVSVRVIRGIQRLRELTGYDIEEK